MWWEFWLPVTDWFERSRHDWNGVSRRRPIGDSICCNWFAMLSRMWMSCIPIGCMSTLFSNWEIERRNLGLGHSAFSVWGSNEPNSLGKIVSPGGP